MEVNVKMKMKVVLIIAFLIIFIFIYNYIQISKVYVNKPIIYSKKLSTDLKITHISDYHGNNRINSKKLLDKIKSFNPHIIVLTGDMIDSSTEDIEPTLKLINDLVNINKNIYFVSGNHELQNIHKDEFLLRLEEMGVIILDNGKNIVSINEEAINICGISFYASKDDYIKAIEGINSDNYTILLSHSPNRPMTYMSGIEDLILSGHTHGGQVRLPGIGAIVAPGQEFFPRYDKGIFELDNTILYIDSGLGNSLAPIRSFNPVQITNMTIKS